MATTASEYQYLENLAPSSGARSSAMYLGLVFAQLFASTLSMIGSSLTIYLAMRKRRERLVYRRPNSDGVYQRLVLSLSFSYIALSVCNIFQVFFIEHFDFLGNSLAFGNWASCRLLASIWTVFMMAGPCYNASLALYFHQTFCCGRKDDELITRFELPVHIIVFVACVAFPAWMYAQQEIVSIYVISCVNGNDATANVLQAILVTGTTSTAIIATYLVCRKARNQLIKTRKYTFESSMDALWDSGVRNRRDEPPATLSTTLERETALQALWYCLSLVNCSVWILLASVVHPNTRSGCMRIFHLSATFFFPLQGMFNFLVYVRPSVSRMLHSPNAHQYSSWVHALWILVREGSDGATGSGEDKNDPSLEFHTSPRKRLIVRALSARSMGSVDNCEARIKSIVAAAKKANAKRQHGDCSFPLSMDLSCCSRMEGEANDDDLLSISSCFSDSKSTLSSDDDSLSKCSQKSTIETPWTVEEGRIENDIADLKT